MPDNKLRATLAALKSHEVRFILVGGLAAVLNGAPVQTYDMDVLYALDDDNVERVMGFLRQADAIFRIQPERRLAPNRSHVSAGGHLNLLTSFGPMDFLGFIGRNLRYEDLLPESHEFALGEGLSLRLLNLETIIRVKEDLASEKDKAVLPLLRETLRRLKKSTTRYEA